MHNNAIDNGRFFDWGRVSDDYGKYRDIYPEIFYKKIFQLGLCRKGQKVLDLGTGTGVLPRNMYKYGADFTGLDISENQIDMANKLSAEANMSIEYVVSSAEAMTFSDGAFDVVTACQCFEYFDKRKVLPEIYRVLKTNGHFCILFMAWLPDESEIAGKSENLILKYNRDWTGAHMKRHEIEFPNWARDLFEVENSSVYDIKVMFTRKSWHGRIRACRGIGASDLSEKEISAWEKEHLEYMDTLPETFEILHYAAVLNLRKR